MEVFIQFDDTFETPALLLHRCFIDGEIFGNRNLHFLFIIGLEVTETLDNIRIFQNFPGKFIIIKGFFFFEVKQE